MKRLSKNLPEEMTLSDLQEDIIDMIVQDADNLRNRNSFNDSTDVRCFSEDLKACANYADYIEDAKTLKEVKQIVKTYLRGYPEIQKYMKKI